MSRDRFVALVGALTIAAVLMGLIVVESRSGPFDPGLSPAEVQVDTRGGFVATAPTGTQAPGGACVPPPGEAACTPARTAVEFTATGLPELPAGVHYVLFLQGGADILPLGALRAQDDAMRLEHAAEVDGRAFSSLAVALETNPAATQPGQFVVHRQNLGGAGQARAVDLSGEPVFGLDDGHGSVHLNQIGAVSVSLVVDAEVHGLPSDAGWAYRAWLVADTTDGPRYTPLGAFDPTAVGTHVLDERVERVDLGAQDRFLVLAQPQDGAPTDVVGFPVFDRPIGR